MGETRIIIVEDDLRFRTAFIAALWGQADCQLMGMASDVESGRRLLQETRPDVMLVDLGLPGGSGFELIREAHLTQPDCDPVVLTVFGDEAHVMAAIEAGATGYLLKDASPAELLDRLRCLRRGGSPISPVIARQLLKRLGPQDAPLSPPSEEDRLSEDDVRVLELTAKGFNLQEIAAMVQQSDDEVASRVQAIYRKLHACTRTEALYEARRRGVLDR